MSGYTRGLAAVLCLAAIPGHIVADMPASAQPPPAEKTGYTFTLTLENSVFYRTRPATRPAGSVPVHGVLRGKLDREGSFIPAPPAEQLAPNLAYPHTYCMAINDRGYPAAKGMPLSEAPNVEAVYEYRSGLLIYGHLKEGGYFVPMVGSKIIPFADYVPGPGTVRIYNLPGEFTPLKK
jgi:hypothetical protein